MPPFALLFLLSALPLVAPHALAAGSGPDVAVDDPRFAQTDAPLSDGLIPDDALPDLTMRPKREKPRAPDAPPPILRDLSKLPAPVRATRDALLKAARSGDIEALRDTLVAGPDGTVVSLSEMHSDPIEHLRQSSGDGEGFEILAILIDILEAGYVHVDAGTDGEMYVWPYFFAWPLEALSKENRVELFRILTAGDVQDSQDFGGYIFYRVGIRADGEWRFFVAGD